MTLLVPEERGVEQTSCVRPQSAAEQNRRVGCSVLVLLSELGDLSVRVSTGLGPLRTVEAAESSPPAESLLIG